MRSPRARTVDALLVVSLVGLGLAEVLFNTKADGPLYVDLPVVAAMGAAVAVRRRHPVAATIGFTVSTALQAAFGSPPPEMAMAFPGLLIFPYTLGAYRPGPGGMVATAMVLCLVPVVDRLVDGGQSSDIFPAVLSLLSYLAGRVVNSKNRLAAELHEAAVLAEEEREVEAAQAVAEERRRVAREMHDIVAHSISVMVVQAGGARRVLERGDAPRAEAAAGSIEAAGREALAEMRRLFGLLHAADDGGPELSPQPGMAGVEALVDRARQSGLRLDFREEGERREVPAGIDLAAYRIVQEALTNAIKYAAEAEAEVRVRWGARDLSLEISDRGVGGAPVNGNGSGGHGLIGMAERVRLYGGELHTGRRGGGGFEVRARLPLTPEEEA